MIRNVIGVLKKAFARPSLSQVIFFVTSGCNLRCQNCFNWRGLNKKDDLSIEEIEKISKSMPSFGFLLLSGGEPFLRDDLPQIIGYFRRNNGIRGVGIPTNGTFTERIERLTAEILQIDSELQVYVYFSLDGLAEFHDESRGVPNSFNKSVESLDRLTRLKAESSNLSVSVNTVVSAYNLDEIPRLIDFLEKKGAGYVDMHYFEIVRGSPRDPSVKDLPEAGVRALYAETILPHQEKLYRQRKGAGWSNFILAKMATAALALEYKIQCDNFFHNAKWGFPCLAGKSSAVISNGGDVSLCELKSSVGNLRQADFEWSRIVDSDVWREAVRKVREDACFCTHNCFITESMYASPYAVFLRLPLLFFRGLFKRYKV